MTRQQLRTWILTKMGEPTIDVELTDLQLDEAIAEAVEYYAQYSEDGSQQGVLFVDLSKEQEQQDGRVGTTSTLLPESVQAVIGVHSTGQGQGVETSFLKDEIKKQSLQGALGSFNNPASCGSGVDMLELGLTMNNVQNILSSFSTSPVWDYSPASGLLKFLDGTSGTVMIKVQHKIMGPLSETLPARIYDERLIKDLSYGLALLRWANVIGKYDSTLVNGSSFNYSDIRSQGQEVIQDAKEELQQLQDPLGIFIF